MPVWTLIGLVLSILKLGMDVAAYLQAHPEVKAEVKTSMAHVAAALQVAHDTLAPHASPPEAP